MGNIFSETGPISGYFLLVVSSIRSNDRPVMTTCKPVRALLSIQRVRHNEGRQFGMRNKVTNGPLRDCSACGTNLVSVLDSSGKYPRLSRGRPGFDSPSGRQHFYKFICSFIWISARVLFLGVHTTFTYIFLSEHQSKTICQKWDSNPRPQKWTATWTQRLRPLGHPD